MRVGRGRKTAGGEAHLVVAGQDIGLEQSILAFYKSKVKSQLEQIKIHLEYFDKFR